MNKKSIFIILLLITINVIISCGTKDKPLAVFDGGQVTQSEYIELYLASTEHKPEKMPDVKNLKKLVTRLAMEKIPVLEARAHNIQNDSSFINGFTRIKYSFLYTPYISNAIGNKIITDSLIKSFYKHFTPQYKLLYIECPYEKSTKKMKRDSIEKIYKELLLGRSFTDMMNQLKENKKSFRAGDYGWVISESIANENLRKAMESLSVNTFSNVIDTQHEFQIIYIANKRDVPVPEFDKVKDKIKNSLIKTRKGELEEAVKQRLKELKKKYNYKIDYAFEKEIENKVIHHVSKKYFKYDFEDLSQEDMERYIATYDGGGVRLKELFERRHKRPDNMIEFRERLEVMARLHLFGKNALELGLDKSPEYKDELDKLFDKYLAYTIVSRNVEKKVKARIDSLIKNKSMNSLEINRERALITRDVKAEYERKLRKKYHYKYITENFDVALKEALHQKMEQVEKKGTKN